MQKLIVVSLTIEEFREELRQIVQTELESYFNKTPKESKDRWLSIEDLCEYLPGNPKKQTIYGLVHKRYIPHKKLGGRLAFLKSEIDEWIMTKKRMTAKEVDELTDTLV